MFRKLNIYNRVTQLNVLSKATCAVSDVTGLITVGTKLLVNF
jgi:hypothetical protein